MVLVGVLAGLANALVRQSLVNERVSAAERQAYTNARVVRAALRSVDTDVTELLSGLQVAPSGEGLLRARGEWFASSVGVDRSLLPESLREGVEQGNAGRQAFRRESGALLAVGVPIAEADALYFEVTSLAEVERSLDVLASSLVVAGGVATAVGAVVGAASSGTVLRPLRRMADVARGIVDGELDSRLDAEGDPDLVPLVTSFNEMLDDLRERIHREARFASDVTHELRGPLAALASAVEVVKRRKDELPEAAVSAVEILAAHVREFNQLVLDLLEISRFETGAAALERRRIDLEAFLTRLVRERGESTTVRVSHDAGSITADPRRLQQLVGNLLDNARNYAGGAVEVAAERSPTGVRLVVDDAGPGVPVDERERIFERFDRGTFGERSDAPRGTGLGLALVAQHARLHGGRVWVEDAPGGGARFVIDLPEQS
ncbi:MAG TPA: HAMP domain-containing sensor histidine kinase [Acidimicrobiia bacterium]|nr:HAMP domain-containing sensor histidine kinase [Acidimicrobiia bacterium]